jgi:hypothetical protein
MRYFNVSGTSETASWGILNHTESAARLDAKDSSHGMQGLRFLMNLLSEISKSSAKIVPFPHRSIPSMPSAELVARSRRC